MGLTCGSVDKDEVDIYCIYCPDTDECYYLRPEGLWLERVAEGREAQEWAAEEGQLRC